MRCVALLAAVRIVPFETRAADGTVLNWSDASTVIEALATQRGANGNHTHVKALADIA